MICDWDCNLPYGGHWFPLGPSRGPEVQGGWMGTLVCRSLVSQGSRLRLVLEVDLTLTHHCTFISWVRGGTKVCALEVLGTSYHLGRSVGRHLGWFVSEWIYLVTHRKSNLLGPGHPKMSGPQIRVKVPKLVWYRDSSRSTTRPDRRSDHKIWRWGWPPLRLRSKGYDGPEVGLDI